MVEEFIVSMIDFSVRGARSSSTMQPMKGDLAWAPMPQAKARK